MSMFCGLFRSALAVAAVLALAGCAGGGDSGSLSEGAGQTAVASAAIPAGKSRLVLSRPSGLLYAGVAATVKVNGSKVADLNPGASSTVDVAAGKAAITVDGWSYPGSWTEDLSLKAGDRYEIEVAAREDGVGTAVVLGAIGGAIEANNNPKSGLFAWKLTKHTPGQSAAAVAPAKAPPKKK